MNAYKEIFNELFKEIIKTIEFKKININFFSTKNKIKIEKNSNYDNTIIKYSSNLIRSKENKNIEILSSEIKNFLTVMESNCKNFVPTLLIKNFKKTLFDIKKINNYTNNYEGYVEYHSLIIPHSFYINNFKTIKHELLHLSTINKNSCGFNNKFKARALNEGYTQLLAERYFNENIGRAYPIEVMLVKSIEQIIGQDQMEKYYFNLDLNSVINDLSKYESKENVLKFIENLNKLLDNDITYINSLTEEQISNFQKIVDDICDFIFSCIESKLEMFLSFNLLLEAEKFLTSFYVPDSIDINKLNSISCNIKFFDDNRKNDIYQCFYSKKSDNEVQSHIEHKKRN